MTSLDTRKRRAALVAETELLAELHRTADPATPIPTCPDWTLADLVAHVGGGHRWAAAMVADRATEFLDFADVPDIRLPGEVESAAVWLRDGARLVTESIDITGPEVHVWTPFGELLPAQWWVRRRLHETTAHHADALLALGRDVNLDPELAADGVSELLGLIEIGSALFQTPLDDGATMSMHATDDAGNWSVRRGGSTILWSNDRSPAAVTVEAAAVDLFLLVLRRITADHPRLTVSGDRSVLDTWLQRTAF